MTHELSEACLGCMCAYEVAYNWHIKPVYDENRREFAWGGPQLMP